MSDPSGGAAPPQTFNFGDQSQQQGAPSQPPQPPAAPPAVEGPSYSDYAKSLLESASPEHKAILEQYVPKWDAGIERRVQQLNDTYGPIDQVMQQFGLGPDDVQLAAQLYNLLDSDPQTARKVLGQQFGWDDPQQPAPQPGYQPPQTGYGQQGQQQYGQPQQQQYAPIPPQLSTQLEQMQQFMQQSAQFQQQMQAQQEQQYWDQQLDQQLSLLQQEFGNFDQEYVLSLMGQGVPGDQAVQRFQQMLQQNTQQQGAPPLPVPPVLSGGAAAIGGKPITQASDKETRDQVLAILNAANAS